MTYSGKDPSDAIFISSFASCPLATDDPQPDIHAPPKYLIVMISQNMTLSTSPTYIVTDDMSVPFALTIKLKSPPAYDPSKGPPSIPGFKKGRSIVIRNPRRKGVKEGKMGFLEVQEGEFLVIRACSEVLYEVIERDVVKRGEKTCLACGTTERVNRCQGCNRVYYCGKECQTKDWHTKNHKNECKILKALTPLLTASEQPSEIGA